MILELFNGKDCGPAVKLIRWSVAISLSVFSVFVAVIFSIVCYVLFDRGIEGTKDLLFAHASGRPLAQLNDVSQSGGVANGSNLVQLAPRYRVTWNFSNTKRLPECISTTREVLNQSGLQNIISREADVKGDIFDGKIMNGFVVVRCIPVQDFFVQAIFASGSNEKILDNYNSIIHDKIESANGALRSIEQTLLSKFTFSGHFYANFLNVMSCNDRIRRVMHNLNMESKLENNGQHFAIAVRGNVRQANVNLSCIDINGKFVVPVTVNGPDADFNRDTFAQVEKELRPDLTSVLVKDLIGTIDRTRLFSDVASIKLSDHNSCINMLDKMFNSINAKQTSRGNDKVTIFNSNELGRHWAFGFSEFSSFLVQCIYPQGKVSGADGFITWNLASFNSQRARSDVEVIRKILLTQ